MSTTLDAAHDRIAARVITARRSAGFATCADAVDALAEAGLRMSPTTYGNLERNMRRLHLAEAVILANVFGVSLSWLAGLPTALPTAPGALIYDVTSCDPETGEVWHTAVAMRTDHDDTETGHWVASWTSQDNGETEYAAHPAEWFTDWSPEAVA